MAEPFSGDSPLRPIVSQWVAKLRLAWDHKKKHFQDQADEAMLFFNGPYDFLYGAKMGRGASTGAGFSVSGDEADVPRPTFAMTVNKVAELVQLFGPALYHKNPVRKVNPRKVPMLPLEVFGNPQDPNLQMQYAQMAQMVDQERQQDQARAMLLEQYLNYTPDALDLKSESRWAIDEAIIKGRGVLWTELYKPSGNTMKLTGSFFDTVDNLVIDPDMEKLAESKWIGRRCVHPYWEVEREYNLPAESLRRAAGLESYNRQGEVAAHIDGDYRRKQGLTNDLVVYWKIFSKMGAGGRLSGVQESARELTANLGDFCYLVICENVPFPLNLPPPLIGAALSQPSMDDAGAQQMQGPAMQELINRLGWPTPYWADDTWPFTPMDFHPVPRSVWPMSHISPAMGELKFLNWAWSFLAGKVKTASRDFLAIAKSASEELKDRIKTGPDYTVLEVEVLHESIDKVVKFLQHPEFNPEIYKIIQGVADNFERRTGLTELMYGQSSRQYRSAEEAQIKGDQVSVRPDDMANKVEDAMSEISRKEALASRWHLTGQDVAPILGQLGGQWWDQFVTATNPAQIMHELDYRIEAGSVKKPNRASEAANMQEAMRNLLAPFMQYSGATGDVGPVNALITGWAKSIDLDPSGFQLQPPPPPPPMPAPGGPASGPGASPGQAPPSPPGGK